jgi:NAD-dependent oxidoreductase involved in siderophore biosynthesis
MIHFSFKTARVHTTVSRIGEGHAPRYQRCLFRLPDIMEYAHAQVFNDLCDVMDVSWEVAIKHLLDQSLDPLTSPVSPAELRTIQNFGAFLRSVTRLVTRVELGMPVRSDRLSFSYINCNTGKSLVWTHTALSPIHSGSDFR